MAFASLSELHGVWEVRPLKNFARADDAHRTLESVCAQVRPLMAARKWRVPLVEEFFPSNASLQGMNVGGGAKIFLRLRPARDRAEFLHFDHVLATMLHELAHNEVGPHNAAFHALNDVLRAEVEALQAKGVTGDKPTHAPGFWAPAGTLSTGVATGPGARLGGARLPGSAAAATTATNRTAVREAMLCAAEQRERRGCLKGQGGQRLGRGAVAGAGARTLPKSRDGKRDLLALAAERRRADDELCGNDVGSPGPASESAPLSSSSRTSSASSSSAASPAASKVVEVIVVDDDGVEIVASLVCGSALAPHGLRGGEALDVVAGGLDPESGCGCGCFCTGNEENEVWAEQDGPEQAALVAADGDHEGAEEVKRTRVMDDMDPSSSASYSSSSSSSVSALRLPLPRPMEPDIVVVDDSDSEPAVALRQQESPNVSAWRLLAADSVRAGNSSRGCD